MFDYAAYSKSLREELHQYPELGFELPKTLAVVHRELDKMGYDAIVMAQVSMRALLPDLKDVKTPLLCSFFTGYGAVADKLNEIAQSR